MHIGLILALVFGIVGIVFGVLNRAELRTSTFWFLLAIWIWVVATAVVGVWR